MTRIKPDKNRDVSKRASSTRLERAGPVEAHNLIYGVNTVLEALRAGKRQIQSIAVLESARPERLRELLNLAREMRVPIHKVPRLELDRNIGEARHQGVVARIAPVRYADPDELIDSVSRRTTDIEPPLVLILDGVEDPHNLGSILRTAECSGVEGIFIPERRATGLTEVVAKVAAGALEHVPVARVTNLVRLIEQLKDRNIWVVGATGDAAQQYTDWDWTAATALVLGNEGQGLHRLVRESCDALVKIPTHGRLDSLNVSVAAGVLLYEARRQRQLRENR
jgi:23S rRNA (guanosine2251-2'-O)-methyltransferase